MKCTLNLSKLLRSYGEDFLTCVDTIFIFPIKFLTVFGDIDPVEPILWSLLAHKALESDSRK